jgi:hypothetical protein
MNDDFVSNNPTPPVTPVILTPEQSLELRANMELVKPATDSRFIDIMTKQIHWKGQHAATPAAIADDKQYKHAIDIFDEMKKQNKALEELRKEYVAFPTKVVSMINGLFKTVRDSIDLSRGIVGKLIQDKKSADEKAALLLVAQAEEKAKAGELESSEIDDGVSKVDFEPTLPELPGNVVESGSGAKVHTRTSLSVEVMDLGEFLKIMTSKQNRLFWLTDHLAEVVKIDIPALSRILKENPTKRKINGLKIEKVEKVV